MTVLALGPEGTFSHELTSRVFGEAVRLVPTISEIFRMVESGGAEGVVPIENSEAGGVGPTLDGLLLHRVFITGEIFMPIHHQLASFVPLDEVRVIYVHPQTHEQCSLFLEGTGLPMIHTSSNAASAQQMLENPGSAAVVSEMTAGLYRLPVIRADVENSPDNVTRFVVISAREGKSETPTKCSILIDPEKDRAGLLYDLLGVFATRNINLTRIESRPSKRGMGSYIFFIDIEYSPACREALPALRKMADFRELGCYRELEVPEWRSG